MGATAPGTSASWVTVRPAKPQTSRYGEMPFLSSVTMSAAYSALLVTKSYLLLSVDL